MRLIPTRDHLIIFFSKTDEPIRIKRQDCSLDGSLQSLIFIANSTWLSRPEMYSDWLKFQKSSSQKLFEILNFDFYNLTKDHMGYIYK